MTSHLEEGLLQELIDGEVPSAQLSPIQAHLAVCAECRARLDEARTIGAEADRLIETIDLTGAPFPVAPRVPRAGPKTWIRNLAWAATVVIATGVGYAARGTGIAGPAESLAVNQPVVVATKPAAPDADVEAPVPRPQPAPTRNPETARREIGGAASAARQRSRDAAASSAGAPAERPRDETKATIAGTLRQLAGAMDSDSIGKKAPKKFGDSASRLEEVVTAGLSDRRDTPSPSAPALAKQAEPRVNANRLDQLMGRAGQAKAAASPVPITFPEALKRLNGSLRLIEGLVPLRLEMLGVDVRVVYPLGSGELVLSERLENGKLLYDLVGPAGFPADSLERLRARVRD